jgi:hypothetical protein
MDENPYKSPRETGYRELREREPDHPPAPILPRTPWLKDRDAVFVAAAIAFLAGAVIILAGLLGTLN